MNLCKCCVSILICRYVDIFYDVRSHSVCLKMNILFLLLLLLIFSRPLGSLSKSANKTLQMAKAAQREKKKEDLFHFTSYSYNISRAVLFISILIFSIHLTDHGHCFNCSNAFVLFGNVSLLNLNLKMGKIVIRKIEN